MKIAFSSVIFFFFFNNDEQAEHRSARLCNRPSVQDIVSATR